MTIVDERTTLEHLYVGMTRGRRTNHALVTTSARGDEHTETPARDARRVLEGVLRRTGNEPSATELLRAALDAGQLDPGRLRAALAEARRAIDSAAGPDRRTTIARLAEQAGRETVAAQELGAAREELNRALAAQQRLQAAASEAIKAPAPPPGGGGAEHPRLPRRGRSSRRTNSPTLPARSGRPTRLSPRRSGESSAPERLRSGSQKPKQLRPAGANGSPTTRRPSPTSNSSQASSPPWSDTAWGRGNASVLHHGLPTFRRPSRSTAQRSESADE